MAILPRTLLTQPAAAAVAAVSLFGFTILGLSALETVERELHFQTYDAPCSGVEDALGQRQFWEVEDFARFAYCFEQRNDPQGAIAVASEGLERFPDAEVLYNIKGYHLIGQRQFGEAIDTLESGIAAVGTPSNEVMENNLAWAYLWVGDGATDRSRSLYEAALQKAPYVCETLHTGLFVEFDVARSSSGIARAEALRNFQSLRMRYQDCANRDASWDTAVEAAGAGVLYNEVERLIESGWDQQGLDLTLRVTATGLRENHASASVAVLCSEAMPLRELQQQCVSQLQEAVRMTSPTRSGCKH